MEQMHMEHKHDDAIDRGWQEASRNEVMKRLKEGEGLQAIMESLPGFKESFTELDTINCSDGRVLDGKKIGIAGSGILLPDGDRERFVRDYRGKVKVLTTHADCGAAALKFKTLKPEQIPAGVTTADEYGTYCGKKMAEDLGAKHEYLEREEMANEYHNETGLVIDQTGRFDSTNLAGFPAHFVCTGAGLGFSAEYMKTEADTLARIALGHHGFGDRFTAEDPFRIVVAAENQEQLDAWIEVGKAAVKDLGDRVAVTGFIAPEK